MKKGQAALDYLTTYSWAILVLTVFLSAFWFMGYYNLPSLTGAHATGFATLKPFDWRYSAAGSFSIVLVNNAGTSVRMVNATLGDSFTTIAAGGTNPGEQVRLDLTAPALRKGEWYDLPLLLWFEDDETNFYYVDSGRVTGNAG